MKEKADLPFVFLNVATTADGKIAPTHEKYVQFSSDYDQELLLKLRTTADAVMCGAATINSFPIDLGPGGKRFREMRLKNGLPEYNLRIVVSGSASVSIDSPLFQRRFSPVIVLTTEGAPKRKLDTLRKAGAVIYVCGDKEVDFPAAGRWLKREWDVNRLLCEGGGAVNWSLLRAGMVNEIYQTICPVIFGGRDAPTLADGEGIKKLSDAIHLRRKGMRRVGDELYLVHEVIGRRGRNSRKCR